MGQHLKVDQPPGSQPHATVAPIAVLVTFDDPRHQGPGPGFRVVRYVVFPAGDVEEPIIIYSWRCRRTHLPASSISFLFKDGMPVCPHWKVFALVTVNLTLIALLLFKLFVTFLPARLGLHADLGRKELAGPISHIGSALELPVHPRVMDACFP